MAGKVGCCVRRASASGGMIRDFKVFFVEAVDGRCGVCVVLCSACVAAGVVAVTV